MKISFLILSLLMAGASFAQNDPKAVQVPQMKIPADAPAPATGKLTDQKVIKTRDVVVTRDQSKVTLTPRSGRKRRGNRTIPK